MTSREFRGKSPLTAMLLAHGWQPRKEDAAERCSYLYIYSVLQKEQNLCVPARSTFPMRKIRPSVAAVAPGAARGTSAPLAACSRGCGAWPGSPGEEPGTWRRVWESRTLPKGDYCCITALGRSKQYLTQMLKEKN